MVGRRALLLLSQAQFDLIIKLSAAKKGVPYVEQITSVSSCP